MTKKDTTDDSVTTPETEEIEEKVEELDAEHAKLEEAKADATPEQRADINERLDKIEAKQESLLEKLDKLLASPVAPSPRRTVSDAPAPERTEVPEQAGTQTPDAPPAAPRKARTSKAWFGERAYED